MSHCAGSSLTTYSYTFDIFDLVLLALVARKSSAAFIHKYGVKKLLWMGTARVWPPICYPPWLTNGGEWQIWRVHWLRSALIPLGVSSGLCLPLMRNMDHLNTFFLPLFFQQKWIFRIQLDSWIIIARQYSRCSYFWIKVEESKMRKKLTYIKRKRMHHLLNVCYWIYGATNHKLLVCLPWR